MCQHCPIVTLAHPTATSAVVASHGTRKGQSNEALANTDLCMSNNKSECDAQQLTGKPMHACDDSVSLLSAWYSTAVEVVGELLLIDTSHFLHAC